MITGVAAVGLAVALTGLRSPRPRPASRASTSECGEAGLEPARG